MDNFTPILIMMLFCSLAITDYKLAKHCGESGRWEMFWVIIFVVIAIVQTIAYFFNK